MLALHIQFLCHLVAMIGKKIVVKGFIVACNTASDARSMGGKNGSDGWNMLANIKQTKTRHPLVALINNLFRVVKIIAIEALYNTTGRIRKHGCLVIIAIGMQTVDLIVGPEVGINLIFICKKGCKINQNSDRAARYCPTSNPH